MRDVRDRRGYKLGYKSAGPVAVGGKRQLITSSPRMKTLESRAISSSKALLMASRTDICRGSPIRSSAMRFASATTLRCPRCEGFGGASRLPLTLLTAAAEEAAYMRPEHACSRIRGIVMRCVLQSLRHNHESSRSAGSLTILLFPAPGIQNRRMQPRECRGTLDVGYIS